MATRLTLTMLLACGLIVLSLGCGGGTTGDETSSSERSTGEGSGTGSEREHKLTKSGQEPAEDDTLLRYYTSDPDTLNLIIGGDNVSAAFQRQVYDVMARRKYGAPQEWENQLAESWEFDEENLEFTIHLRKDVLWHPITLPNGTVLKGKKLTSRDVKFTFDCVLNPHIEAASLRSYYTTRDPETGEEIPRVEVTRVDDYTVKVKWTEPYFMAHEFTLTDPGIMPRHVYSVDENGEPISFDFSSKEFADGFNNHWANSTMCGTGPMIFKEWKKSERAVMERNPDYYGPPYYFSRIVFQYISNPNTARQKMLQNELDLATLTEVDHYIDDQDHENVKAGKVILTDYRATAYRYMGYNLQRPVFEDRNVRTALSHAVPVQEIIDRIYHGLATRQTGPFLPWGDFANPDIEPIPFDLDVAKKLLDEAGWKDSNEDGTRDKQVDGKRVEFNFDLMIFSDSPQYLSIAEIIKENFRRIGVSVQISPTKWALMLQKLRKKEFDATILGWVADWKSDPYQLWHGSQADLPESSNFVAYRNREVDENIDKLRMTMKEEDQIALYHEIHRLIYEDQPYTFLYAEKVPMGYHARLENLTFYPSLRPHYNTREWWANKARMVSQ